MDRRFLGSTVALMLGLFFLTTGVIAANRGQDAVPQILGGVGALVGGLAFRSLRRRTLGLCDNSIRRRVVEGVALAAVVALFLLHGSVRARINREPVSNLPIPAWEQLLADVNPSGDAGFTTAAPVLIFAAT